MNSPKKIILVRTLEQFLSESQVWASNILRCIYSSSTYETSFNKKTYSFYLKYRVAEDHTFVHQQQQPGLVHFEVRILELHLDLSRGQQEPSTWVTVHHFPKHISKKLDKQ